MITLGIDCGTQSTKTIALDTDTGRMIASAAQAYDVLPGLPPGHLEQNPTTWTEAVDATIRQVVEKLGARRGEVRGAVPHSSHFGSAEVSIWDAPRRGEIVFALCVATGGRVHERVGGLRQENAKMDGLT